MRGSKRGERSVNGLLAAGPAPVDSTLMVRATRPSRFPIRMKFHGSLAFRVRKATLWVNPEKTQSSHFSDTLQTDHAYARRGVGVCPATSGGMFGVPGLETHADVPPAPAAKRLKLNDISGPALARPCVLKGMT